MDRWGILVGSRDTCTPRRSFSRHNGWWRTKPDRSCHEAVGITCDGRRRRARVEANRRRRGRTKRTGRGKKGRMVDPGRKDAEKRSAKGKERAPRRGWEFRSWSTFLRPSSSSDGTKSNRDVTNPSVDPTRPQPTIDANGKVLTTSS